MAVDEPAHHGRGRPPFDDAPGPSAAPRFAFAGVAWRSLEPDVDADDKAEAEARGVAEEAQARLHSVLSAERLVILAGLGTSIGLRGLDGVRHAPSMYDLWVAVSALSGFSSACTTTGTAEDGDIESLLSRCQFSLALEEKPDLRDFVDQAENTILDRCRFIDDTTDLEVHELFLRKVARRSTRHPRTQLFTTNYDLAFERAADRAGFHLVDGFGLTHPRRFDGSAFDLDFVRRRVGERPVFEPNVAQLLKLHGSVDWSAEGGEVIRDPTPKRPVLIYPTQTKFQLSYERPYLECMARFQMALREPDVGVIVIGLGLNDEHLAGPLRAAVRSNVGLRLTVVDPTAETNTNATFAFLRQLVELGDARITLVAGSFESFTTLVPETTAPGEREAHEHRVGSASSIIEA